MIQEFQIFSVWFRKARWLHLPSDPHVHLIEVGEVVQRLGRGFTEAVLQRTVQIREDFSTGEGLLFGEGKTWVARQVAAVLVLNETS